MTNRLLFLGTGASLGVPVVGCRCVVCTSKKPYNKRLRPSILLFLEGRTLLIDAGPDFRAQALQYHINTLDGVIVTHAHNDHIAGLDELRAYHLAEKRAIPCLMSMATHEDLKRRYAYIFSNKEDLRLISQFDVKLLPQKRGVVEFLGVKIYYTTYEQAGMLVNGFRFGDIAYVSDIKQYEETIFDDLAGVKVLIISALRQQPSPLHFSVTDAILFSEKVGVKNTWFTHIDHTMDHEETNAVLPTHIQLAYDGQEIHF